MSARFVRLLTDERKQTHVDISQELFATTNGTENFLKNFLTGDETWVYGYDIETSQWVSSSSKSTNKSVKDQCEVLFFYFKGIVLKSFYHGTDSKHRSLPANSSTFKGCCAQKGAFIVGKKTWMLHHDNAPALRCFFSADMQQILYPRCAPSPVFAGSSPRLFPLSQT